MIPRDFECWYWRNNRHERCALREACACYVCYPRDRALMTYTDPFSQYDEGQVAVETLERFLAERQAERQS